MHYLFHPLRETLKLWRESKALFSSSTLNYIIFRFKKSRDPYREIDRNMDKVNPKDKEVRKSFQRLRYECKEIRGGTYAAKIALIPDHSIRVILGMIKESGLAEWHPDVLGVPDSFYNQLHKQAFMKCFEATVLNGGYR